MTEVQAVLTSMGAFVIINIIGWSATYFNNRNHKAVLEGMEQAHRKNIEARLNKLPCESDPNYMVNLGKLLQATKDIQGRLERIEKAQNGRAV